jgi:fatty-acid desaturase
MKIDGEYPILVINEDYRLKRAFVIFLLTTYSISAIGVSIHLHYCMDRFAGWSLSKERMKNVVNVE